MTAMSEENTPKALVTDLFEEKRFGYIYISANALREVPLEAYQLLFKDLVVLAMRDRFERGEVEYFAASPQFDSMQEDEIIPAYQIKVDEDGTVTYTRIEA